MNSARWRRYAGAVVLVLGGVLFLAAERTVVATGNPVLVPSVVLLGAATVPAAVLVSIYGRLRRDAAGAGAVATAALVGGLAGTLGAVVLEYEARRAFDVLPMIGVGLVEETCKLLVVVAALVLLRRHRSAADGLVMGVAVGAGFAVFETMGYAFTTLLRTGGNLNGTVELLLTRGVLSPAGHMAWTGIAATALFAAAGSGWRLRLVLVLGAAFTAAVGMHTLWDSWQTRPGMSLTAAAGLLLLAWTIHRVGMPVHPPTSSRGGRATTVGPGQAPAV